MRLRCVAVLVVVGMMMMTAMMVLRSQRVVPILVAGIWRLQAIRHRPRARRVRAPHALPPAIKCNTFVQVRPCQLHRSQVRLHPYRPLKCV